MMQISVNHKIYTLDIEEDTPILWVLRDHLGLMGTKYSCGIGICGSCTILINGLPERSCVTEISQVIGKEITTIEGISEDNSHPVQQAWQEQQVPQCGYCQSGQIMTAIALLDRNADPSDEEIDEVMSGVLCRCGTYPRIKKAIKLASKTIAIKEKDE
ncbi:MAG: (2Fe-2S)-binding protein [Gammaproteobacteria bacterium]|nr:(2Fe-2S)-binding protein [Gammaproteobacteria bacterium]